MRLSLALLCLLAATSARADDVVSEANTFTLAPLPMALGYWSVEYERRVAPHWSVYAQPGVAMGMRDPQAQGLVFDGAGLAVGARFFPFWEAPSGFFVALQAQGITGTTRVEGSQRSASALGVGVTPMGGYSFLLWRWLDVSLGLGAELDLSSVGVAPDRSGAVSMRFQAQPVPRINAGFSF